VKAGKNLRKRCRERIRKNSGAKSEAKKGKLREDSLVG